VLIHELQQSAAIFLQQLVADVCPQADADASHSVEITELQQATIAFLFQCP
jgi:hypothetical protein